jgi:hypothetical protein
MVMQWLKWFGIGVGGLALTVVVGVLVAQRVADGPMLGFLQGGPLRSGEPVPGPIEDWSFAVGKSLEFELVGFGTSRTAGIILHDGVPYISCDLGFIWNRLEGGIGRAIPHAIYLFKHWHTDAEEDGRVRMRIEGRIYEGTLTRVQDPGQLANLKATLEDLARGYMAPTVLGPPPAEPPNDIWFFRVDPPA